MADTMGTLNSNYINALQEKQFGFNKKKFFTKRDTRGLQTRIELNLSAIPVCLEPEMYHNHHHHEIGTKKKQQFLKGPDMPIHDHTLNNLEKEYLYMSNQREQRKRHRGVSK